MNKCQVFDCPEPPYSRIEFGAKNGHVDESRQLLYCVEHRYTVERMAEELNVPITIMRAGIYYIAKCNTTHRWVVHHPNGSPTEFATSIQSLAQQASNLASDAYEAGRQSCTCSTNR